MERCPCVPDLLRPEKLPIVIVSLGLVELSILTLLPIKIGLKPSFKLLTSLYPPPEIFKASYKVRTLPRLKLLLDSKLPLISTSPLNMELPAKLKLPETSKSPIILNEPSSAPPIFSINKFLAFSSLKYWSSSKTKPASGKVLFNKLINSKEEKTELISGSKLTD